LIIWAKQIFGLYNPKITYKEFILYKMSKRYFGKTNRAREKDHRWEKKIPIFLFK